MSTSVWLPGVAALTAATTLSTYRRKIEIFRPVKILLIPDILVGGHEQLEAGCLGGIEQSAVSKPLSSTFNRFDDHVTFQCISQRGWCAVVKQDKPLPLMSRPAAGLAMGRGFVRQIQGQSRSVPASGGTTP